MLGDRARLSAALINGLSGKPRRPQGGADPGANLAVLLLPIITVNMNDWPARTDPEEAAIGPPDGDRAPAGRGLRQPEHPTGLRRRAPAARRLARRPRAPRCDLAAYLAELHDAGRASSSASMAVAAACFRAKLAGQPAPAGERTARVLAGYRRTAGRSGARTSAAVRGLGLGGRARHLPPAAASRARRRVRPGRPRARASRCGDRRTAVHGGNTAERGERAALGRRRGASTTDVMLAGNWKTSRMVAHYSAGATAERGAVARYL